MVGGTTMEALKSIGSFLLVSEVHFLPATTAASPYAEPAVGKEVRVLIPIVYCSALRAPNGNARPEPIIKGPRTAPRDGLIYNALAHAYAYANAFLRSEERDDG
jgi:hypothetical protein